MTAEQSGDFDAEGRMVQSAAKTFFQCERGYGHGLVVAIMTGRVCCTLSN
jgi:hypothetical protein